MFQIKDNVNLSPYTEGDNKKKKHKKVHISNKSKHCSKHKHGHSKHRKKWDLNINNPHLKHAKYTSDYIGPDRLTKHLLGFLGKGKISDSISRFEKIMPENCKALSKHDLNRILNSSSGEIHSYNHDFLPQKNENCSSSSDESNTNSPSPQSYRTIHKSVSVDSRKEKSNFSVNFDTESSMNSKSSPSPLSSKYNETVICREVITKKLHSVVSNANKAVYPNISNQKRLMRELFNLKNEYDSSRKSLSSSNNGESSQDTKNTSSLESFEKEFKLNPILTQESPIAKSIENMFPDSQDVSSDSDSFMSEDSVLSIHHLLPPQNHDEMKLSVSSSGREGSLTLIPSSPISSSGSPVWAPELSPTRFVPDVLPTPKLFYRQKMF